MSKESKTVQTSIILTKSQNDLLEALAENEGVTKGRLLGQALAIGISALAEGYNKIYVLQRLIDK